MIEQEISLELGNVCPRYIPNSLFIVCFSFTWKELFEQKHKAWKHSFLFYDNLFSIILYIKVYLEQFHLIYLWWHPTFIAKRIDVTLTAIWNRHSSIFIVKYFHSIGNTPNLNLSRNYSWTKSTCILEEKERESSFAIFAIMAMSE